MERMQVKGNTWCLKGRQLIPYYQVDERHCVLLDAGRANEREEIAEALEAAGLTPVGILLTHMHYDHHENTKYFKEKYGIPAAMPRGEAEICRSAATLKNHLFCFTPGLIATTPRLQNLICPIERPIEQEEQSIFFGGATFGILRSPGHSPDHICITTPDNVGYLGDAVMAGQDLERSQVPFVFGVELDIASKRRLLDMNCDRYIVAHIGIVEGADFPKLVEENIALILRQAEMMRSLITKPMTYCDCYAAINQHLGQADGHPVWNQHLERYLRPYLEYLLDIGQLQLVGGTGAPTLAPLEDGP